MDGWTEPAQDVHAAISRRPQTKPIEQPEFSAARRDTAAEEGGEISDVLGEAAWRRLHPEVRRRFAVGRRGKADDPGC